MTNGGTNEVLRPASVEDVVAAVRSASENNRRLSLSRAGAEGASRIDLAEMAGVVDYPARDMTVTVQAGMAYSELAAILLKERQQLPIDVADSSSTVGSLAAGDVAGPRRYGYGTLRDYLIGMEAVDGRGRVFHAGGRVVKNVAGYDLCRLLVGSQGTLGVLTQLTFKLKPIPDFSAGIEFVFADTAALDSALTRLNTTAATPIVLDVRSTVGPHRRLSLFLIVEGSQQACDWQIDTLRGDCANAIDSTVLPSPECALDYGRQPDRNWQENEIQLRIRPSQVAEVIGELSAAEIPCKGHAGNGIIYVADYGDTGKFEQVCMEIANRCNGLLTRWSAPDPGVDADLIHTGIRRTFDPDAVFVS